VGERGREKERGTEDLENERRRRFAARMEHRLEEILDEVTEDLVIHGTGMNSVKIVVPIITGLSENSKSDTSAKERYRNQTNISTQTSCPRIWDVWLVWFRLTLGMSGSLRT